MISRSEVKGISFRVLQAAFCTATTDGLSESL